jgi:uncharacterized protein YndB with AHSA1/START domain
MKTVKKKRQFKFERTIAASPSEVYDAWLNPKITGTPWNVADKLILNPQVDGFYYLLAHGFSHYGRFTETERPNRVQHTWVSPHTMGEESTVYCELQRTGRKNLDDSRAFRSSQY